MTLRIAVVLLVLASLAASRNRPGEGNDCSSAARDAAQRDADVAQIKAATHEFVQGFNSGDLDRVMRLYADHYLDINLKDQRQTHAQRAAYYKQIIDRHNTEVEVTPEEILVDGNHAVARGSLLLFKVGAQGRSGEPITLRYVEVWERQAKGWRSIWGMDAEIYPESR